MTKKNLKLAHLQVLVWCLLLFLSGCCEGAIKVYDPIDYSNGDEYIAFTTDGVVTNFSFEYPSDYNLHRNQLNYGWASTSVNLSDIDYQYPETILDGQVRIYPYSIEYPPEAEWDYKLASISVNIVSEYFPEAETAVDERIASYKRWVTIGCSEDFKLLEKNRVMIAGMEGWEIVVSYTDLPVDFLDSARTRAVPVVCRDLFFDYQDTVWHISVYSDAGNADQAKLDYEHILGTLRILD